MIPVAANMPKHPDAALQIAVMPEFSGA